MGSILKKIDEFLERGKGKISLRKVVKFPTRIDVNYFKPAHNSYDLKERERTQTFIALGRLAKVKVWDLLLDAFRDYIDRCQETELFFCWWWTRPMKNEAL